MSYIHIILEFRKLYPKLKMDPQFDKNEKCECGN